MSSRSWFLRNKWLSACVPAIAAAIWLARTPALPVPQVASLSRPDSQGCAECHVQQHAEFETAPHARTLRRLDDPELLKTFADHSDRELTWSVQYGSLIAHASLPPRAIPLDWAFGSGQHAITPVATQQISQGQTALLEHRYSWYPPGEVQPTLGLSKESASNLEQVGKWHSPAEAARCFGCHSTRVPQTEGRLQLDRLIPNVQCDRCHQGSQEHAVAMRAGQPDSGLLHWPALNSLDAINRCGECHRRRDEFTPDELRPENTRLVRFAPVGLAQSPCFQPGAKQPANHADSLTCVRCHDPHQPAQTDADYYRQRCLECHNPQGQQHRSCSVQPPESHCTTCHMPKVPLNPWLSFTDHWIRVR